MLVDEYQDTNRTQYDLIRLAAWRPHGNLTVVGDEDQSIYSWRGADIRNILDFEHDFPGARVLRLEENYRSTQAILDAASGLVAHNRARKGKTLRAVKAGGAPVRLHQAGDEYQEAAWVVDRIAAARGGGRRAAVLFRMNAQSRLFEEGAAARGACPTWWWAASASTSARRCKDVLVLPPADPEPPRPPGPPARAQRPRARHRRHARSTRSSARRPRAGASRWEALGAVVRRRAAARARHPAPARASAR